MPSRLHLCELGTKSDRPSKILGHMMSRSTTWLIELEGEIEAAVEYFGMPTTAIESLS